MEPSEQFKRFAQTLALFESTRLYGGHPTVLARRLWDAAIFDWFHQSGELVRMHDALDVPLADARAYTTVIQVALERFAQGTVKA
jgi:hypothetical protein